MDPAMPCPPSHCLGDNCPPKSSRSITCPARTQREVVSKWPRLLHHPHDGGMIEQTGAIGTQTAIASRDPRGPSRRLRRRQSASVKSAPAIQWRPSSRGSPRSDFSTTPYGRDPRPGAAHPAPLLHRCHHIVVEDAIQHMTRRGGIRLMEPGWCARRCRRWCCSRGCSDHHPATLGSA